MPRSEIDERIVDIVRQQTRIDNCPVATKDVIDIAWRNGYEGAFTYAQTTRALARLVRTGVLVKPTRGNYLLAEAAR